MGQGYTEAPPDVSSTISSPQTIVGRAQQLWHHPSNSERAPLLDRQRMTLEPPKKTATKATLTAICIVFTLLLVGASVAVWIEIEPVFETRPLSEMERLLLKLPSNDSIRNHLRTYASEAHVAGTEADRRQAEWTRDRWVEMGISNTTIEIYHPLLTHPLQQRFALVTGPEELRFEARLSEDDEGETVPAFHGYSKNGTAVGPVVYANYGRLQDFQLLRDRGVVLAGSIALLRAGQGIPDGTKVRAAHEFGCVGALIYPDPDDDGPIGKHGFPHTHPAKAYPDGPWRPPSSIRRGSVEFSSWAGGDPLTPGWPATTNASRLHMDDASALARIPSLPLSYRDALALLKAMEGHGILGDKHWRGGFTEVGYYSGPTEGSAELVNIVDNKVAPVWNVVATVEGSQESDRAIILGNHRDAWAYGAVDPSSGSAAMMELAKVFGVLLKRGWRPARTIVLCSWDAGAYDASTGSSEWVEDHQEWIDRHAAIYINVDAAVSGPHFAAQASPSLNRLLYDITNFVQDPHVPERTVYDAWASFTNRTGIPSAQPTVGDLVSRSDFVPFLHHAGVASINLGFEGDYGVQHSSYDSIRWMETFGDPDFHYHTALVKIWALMAMRLADSPIFPVHPSDYAAALSAQWQALSDYRADTAGSTTDSLAGTNIKRFRLLFKSIHKLTKVSERLEKGLGLLESEVHAYHHLSDVPSALKARLRNINDRLAFFERHLLDPDGIQERPWYKHVVYGPRLWSGHATSAPTAFPGIVDAIDAEDIAEAVHAEERAALSIRNAAKSINT